MDDRLELQTADGRTLTFPMTRVDATRLVADTHCEAEVNVTEVHVFSDALDRPRRVEVPSLTMLAGERGRWTVTVNRDQDGDDACGVEYFATEQFGERVREPVISQWDEEKEEMVAD